ncbi:MAG: hypothetical protein KGQ66_20905 [Acidobacteriota bacterium]|nr:hypothetical protein [Acidobacteriota bacterium]
MIEPGARAAADAIAAAMDQHGVPEVELRAERDGPDRPAGAVSLWSVTTSLGASRGTDEGCLGRIALPSPLSRPTFDELFAALQHRGLVRHHLYPLERDEWFVVPDIWLICRDDLPLDRMSVPDLWDAVLEPAAESAPRLTFADLRGSDLFSWFNLSEKQRTTWSADLTRLDLEPGAFSAAIDFAVLVNGFDVIAGAKLALDRSFVDQSRPNLAAATDLTVSLLRFLAGADPLLDHVGRQLEAVGLEAAGTITGGYDRPTSDPGLTPLLRLFVEPLAGRMSVRGRQPLRAGNLLRAGGRWFDLEWGRHPDHLLSTRGPHRA